MESTDAHPSGTATPRPDPRPGIPKQLQASYRLWLLAVTAGLFETALVVVDATTSRGCRLGGRGRRRRRRQAAGLHRAGVPGRPAAPGQKLGPGRPGGAVRRDRHPVAGDRAGRLAGRGGSLTDAVAAADLGSVLFVASRVVHLGAVIAALLLMFQPAASAYLRANPRTPTRGARRQDWQAARRWAEEGGSDEPVVGCPDAAQRRPVRRRRGRDRLGARARLAGQHQPRANRTDRCTSSAWWCLRPQGRQTTPAVGSCALDRRPGGQAGPPGRD